MAACDRHQWTPDLQREKVAATGLDEHVDVVAVSSEIGAGKPDAVIFEFALTHLDVPASAAWMVGDSLDRVMKGATQLGMQTVWRPGPNRPLTGSLRSAR